MAYLNCPFCPAQALSASTEPMLEYGMGLVRFECSGGKHKFYVEEKEINGEQQGDSYNMSN